MEKNIWRRWVTDYFTFNRRERWAVIVLVLLIILLLVLPRFIPETEPDLVAEDSLAMAVIRSWQTDSSTTAQLSGKDSGARNYSPAGQRLFHFDPNKASPGDWMQLGVKERTTVTISRFLEKGGRFRNAQDLDKIYGLPAALADKLKPYVRIEELPDRGLPGKRKEWTDKPRVTAKVNINTADSGALVALPGIGPKLAARIIGYRDKLGGFHRIGQLLEVYGIRDSLLIVLAPYLESGIGPPRQIEMNSVNREELRQHPYFRGPFANAVVSYRDTHGPFQFIGDLMKIHLADSAWIKKVEPYCNFR